jgi:hypothetical protein
VLTGQRGMHMAGSGGSGDGAVRGKGGGTARKGSLVARGRGGGT